MEEFEKHFSSYLPTYQYLLPKDQHFSAMRCFKEDILHLNRWKWTIYLWQPTDHQKGIWCCSLHTAGWCNAAKTAIILQGKSVILIPMCCFVLKVVEKWLKWRSSGTLEDFPHESQNLLEIKEQHWICPKKWNFVQIIVMCCSNQECSSIWVDKVSN